MGKTIKEWLEKPLYVYLIGLFYLVYRTSQYFPSFDLGTFSLFITAYVIITFLLLFGLKKIGLARYSTFQVFLFWVIVFFFIDIKNGVFRICHLEIRIRYVIIIDFLLLAFLFLKKKQKLYEPSLFLNKIINSFLLFITLITLCNGFLVYMSEKKHQAFLDNKKFVLNDSLNIKKDIIWILMDEYGAPQCLQSQFNFHDDFKDSLKTRGFFVYDSMPSRNDTTIYSINSLFNLDDTSYIPNYMYADKYLKESKWVNNLESKNYSFKCFDFLNIYNTTHFSYLPIFQNTYIEEITINSILLDLFPKLSLTRESFDSYNQKVKEKIFAEVSLDANVPRFIWAHLLIPHVPYCRNANGEILSESIDPSFSPKEKYVHAYLEYLQYGNKQVLEILSKIPDIKNKTIIISGDHGFRFPYLDPNSPIRKATFCAIYYPNMDTTELKQIKYLQQIPFHLRY